MTGSEPIGPISYWWGVQKDLESLGCRVYMPRVPTAPIEPRALALKDKISQFVEKEGVPKVHLIAHSMGGLDARCYVSRLEGFKYVATLTTIASPHRGSTAADWLYATSLYHLVNLTPIPYKTFFQMMPAYLEKEFNPNVPDHPDVSYFSLAGSPPPMFSPLRILYQVIKRREGENDGAVSTTSAKWGEFLGFLNQDHIQQMNWSIAKAKCALPYFRFIASVQGQEEVKRGDALLRNSWMSIIPNKYQLENKPSNS
eukprot:TRINITY_DN873_c0_g2_i1.p1 TRINITY_DN873_c0_g2~~TRINITY_DN873_c0_g2_i1.p1  ORF type:complete len:256 (-),score=48.15 TRINITY_DN873_c0_g2_i1:8-775(-)